MSVGLRRAHCVAGTRAHQAQSPRLFSCNASELVAGLEPDRELQELLALGTACKVPADCEAGTCR